MAEQPPAGTPQQGEPQPQQGSAYPPAGQPQQGSAYPPNAAVPPPGPRPPEREGLSTGCWVGVVILAAFVLVFGVCLVSLSGLSYE